MALGYFSVLKAWNSSKISGNWIDMITPKAESLATCNSQIAYLLN